MKFRASLASALLLATAAAGPVVAQHGARQRSGPAHPWMNAALSPDARAAMVVREMTRDEKLTLVFGWFGTDFPAKQFKAPAGALPGSAGYVPPIPRLGIPAQWQTDAGVGVATQGGAPKKRERTSLPSGIATAASWDPDNAYRGGAMIGDEARRSGFNVMLAGGVNLLREPRNGRNFEYAGEDPLLAGTMVGAQIRGIQSNHIISTIKHYAINDQETDRNAGNSVIDPAAARVSDLLAFQFGIERSDPGSVMCSYNKVNGTYACENRFLMNDVLRRDWKWPGYVMSDWGATHSTVGAANAGLEQESGNPFDDQPYFGAPLRAAVQSGAVPETRLTEMASRILRSMFAHGLFDHPVAEQRIDMAAHADVTRADAEAGAVLLRNENALLPIASGTRHIAVIGGHADKGVLAGGGSSLVYPVGGNGVPGLMPKEWPGPVMYHPSAPLDAIRRLAPGATVRFADGSDPAAAARLAADSDVVVLFATQWAGESFDPALRLDANQDALIDAVAAANPRTAVVLETGGPVLMPWANRVGAILEAWYPGTSGGEAIANLLFGRVNPSGHLPATFPASLDQLPHPETPHNGDVRYTEGATIGYKWFDAQGARPLFPFGHGLSYTRFGYDGLTAQAANGTVVARFRVSNVGPVAGQAVPQIYVAPVAGSAWEAPKRLGGWKKLPLAPGASAYGEVTVDPRLLATWNEARREWRIAGGTYRVMLAASATDIQQTVTVRVPARTLPVGWRPTAAN
ncbi:beta-glucosidase [Sphingomonas gellani]|uniref:Beta-glucosidase n=1 Tax=Sphingomonas gellani TaxID=1166340 RepID=A0A1H8DUQ1_9SPHN|nr:glycoside hydrolase family 3 protein [Sphingomonas gellani]SEN10258.1 beta-glucosidase [Sphingomonas gellani]